MFKKKEKAPAEKNLSWPEDIMSFLLLVHLSYTSELLLIAVRFFFPVLFLKVFLGTKKMKQCLKA